MNQTKIKKFQVVSKVNIEKKIHAFLLLLICCYTMKFRIHYHEYIIWIND